MSVKGGHTIATEPATGSTYRPPAVSTKPEPAVFGVAAPAGTTVHTPLTTPAPPSSSSKRRKAGGVCWEFDFNGSWRAFGDDCQSYMEQKYKQFKEGSGKAQVKVRTAGMEFSINFESMTSKK